jgi:hypothetical protein
MSQTIELLTYADLIDHLLDYLGGATSAHKVRQAKRAIEQGYDNFRNDHQWPYYWQIGRVCTEAPYEAGTVAYDFTGGTVERQLTLTSGTWPDWAVFGSVLIGSVFYEVAERTSDTILQLDINRSPKEDLAAGTSYQLVRDTYTLPSDLVNIDELYTPESWHKIDYVHPREYLVAHRYNTSSAATPQFFTVRGSPDYMGSMAISFYPFPDSEQTIDFIYQRRGRPLRIERAEGVASGSTGALTLTFTSGNIWKEEMEGSIIRVTGDDGTEFPSGRTGTNPYDEERTIMEVSGDAQTITVDQQWLRSHNNCRFTISDPMDIEPGIMTGVLLRRCEMEVYTKFLNDHREYADRVKQPRAVGNKFWGRRISDMPSGADVE